MAKQNKLKIIPLGGLGEIGKNITVHEYKDSIVIVDCGMTFPEDEMLGVDILQRHKHAHDVLEQVRAGLGHRVQE